MRQLSHFERETSFLSQYRTRLIVDVVTGKLDVREAATRLPEGANDQELLVDANALSYDSEDANDDLAAASEDEDE